MALNTKGNSIFMPVRVKFGETKPSYNMASVNYITGRVKVTYDGTHDTLDWFVDSIGTPIFRERYNNSSNTYRLEKFVKQKWETFYQVDNTTIPPIKVSGLMPDHSGVVFTSQTTGYEDFSPLMKLNFNGETSGPILAKKALEIDTVLTDHNRTVLGVKYTGLEPLYDFLDYKLQASIEFVQENLPNATIHIDSWTDDRSKVLYHMFEPSLGDAWFIHDTNSDSLNLFSTSRPDIPPEALGQVYSIEYNARDGLTIPAIVTLPPDADFEGDVSYPLIALPHGGPASHDSLDFNWMAQFLANRGYVVLQPNFRGSTGFGEAFLDAGKGEWGGKMQDDITDGIKALTTIGIADPERVCIVGASYGGYAALAGATFTPDLYKCVIAIAPVSDLNRMLRDEKRQSGSDHWVIDYWEMIMVDGDARRAKLDSISPAKFADAVQAPVLLLHGDDDTVVPIVQSTIMKRALERADKQVKFVKLKGEDHWLSVAETRLQLLQEMDAFLKEHLPVTAAD